MKRKSLLSLALLGLTIGLASCTNPEDGPSENNEDAIFEKFEGELERNVEIKVLENDTAIKQGYLDELIAAFNEEYKEYGITAVDANMGEFADLAQAGPYGYGPDVLYQANDVIMKYVDQKHITPLPLDKLEAYDKIPEKAWDAYEANVNDTEYTFGVPINIQTGLLYYRQDLLPQNWKEEWDDNKNDVPDMVEYWTEMYAYSKEVKAQSDGKKFGYMKSLFDTYFSAGYLFSYGGYIFGDNGRDTKDIGFAADDSYKGAYIIRQLASVMNEDCIDDTITVNAYSMIANGTYFSTMTTPDVYTMFIEELTREYMKTEKLNEEDAEAKAKENLVVADLPKLPASGDLEDRDGEMIDSIMMGGIYGYAISSYTKSPNACLAFINFAT